MRCRNKTTGTGNTFSLLCLLPHFYGQFLSLFYIKCCDHSAGTRWTTINDNNEKHVTARETKTHKYEKRNKKKTANNLPECIVGNVVTKGSKKKVQKVASFGHSRIKHSV